MFWRRYVTYLYTDGIYSGDINRMEVRKYLSRDKKKEKDLAVHLEPSSCSRAAMIEFVPIYLENNRVSWNSENFARGKVTFRPPPQCQ